MLDWLREELTEARLLRTVHGVNNRTASELARMMYASLLALEILRYEDPDAAKRYAQQTVWLGSYDKLNPGATDLYNVMVILSNQDEYEDLIKTNYDISPGLLEANAYLRRIWSGSPSTLQDRYVLLNLSKLLHVDSTVDLMTIRRHASFWDNSRDYEQKMAVKLLLANIRRLGPALDLFGYLQRLDV
jgi:hypothetical protein